MKPASSLFATIIRFAPLLVVLLAPACHKKDPEPDKATMLAAHSWKSTSSSLTINGYEGTRTLSGSEVYTLVFGSDGRVTSQAAGSAATSGTWKLQNNDTQLVVQTGSSAAQTLQVFELTTSKLSYGLQYDAAAIQQQQAAGTGQMITALILLAGSFTFPANTPTIPANQVTGLQYKINFQ